jgi:hypothetical protein
VRSRPAIHWLLGFAGPKHEAEQIKSGIAAFRREELKLELSQSKTLIAHATNQAAHFSCYKIRAQHSNTEITRDAGRQRSERAVRAQDRQRCTLSMSTGKPAQRGALIRDIDFTIVAKYGSEYTGLVQVLPPRPRSSRSPVERDRGPKPLVARFGGIPVKRNRTTARTDQRPL